MWKVTEYPVARLYLIIVSLYNLIFWFETKRQESTLEFLLIISHFGYCKISNTIVLYAKYISHRQHEFILLIVIALWYHHLLHRVNQTCTEGLAMLCEAVCLPFPVSCLCVTAAPHTFFPLHIQSTGKILNGVVQSVGWQLEGLAKPVLNDH